MAISFSCDNCSCELEVDDSASGMNVSCPDCRTVLTVPRPLRASEAEAPAVVIEVADESVANRSARFQQSVERRGGVLYKIITVFGVLLLMIGIRLLRYVDMDGNFSLHPHRSPLSLEAMQDPDAWRRVTSDDQKFSVLMPGKPSWNNERFYGAEVRTATVDHRGGESRWISFSTGYLPLKDKTDESKERFFAERLDGVKSILPDTNLRGVKRVSISDSDGDVHPGIEFTHNLTIANETLVNTERLYIVDDILVALEVHASKPYSEELQEHFQTFLNSLEVQ